MRYDELEENKWMRPVRTGWRHACCDCGSVHDVDFKVVKAGRGNRVYMRFRANRMATAAMRRHMTKEA